MGAHGFLPLPPMISFLSEGVSIDLSYRAVSSQVLSAQMSLTTVFGMGTGGPSSLKTLTIKRFDVCFFCFLLVGALSYMRKDGAPSGIRTRDPLIKSQLLYQLS